jgi:hypothetical protein
MENQKQITENNILLAEFMNHKPTFEVYIDDVLTTLERPIKNYNSDWNWLMEVVEKCFKTDGDYSLHKEIEDALIFNSENRIQDVYNACVEFVKWYNEQK